MMSFFWSAGHFGWPFFVTIVFSVLCLLVTDIVWRTVPTSIHKLLTVVAVVWVAGVGFLIALSFA